ncbi:hypothetical protein CDD83_5598 [Cordyceps sp. RAO-2017]|nr:hypothetical protein CDD83_5598 [Cordyceps sp. RAO-2017]
MDGHSLGNARNLHIHVEEAPPPPYTETDIYSNSAGPRSPTTTNRAASPHLATDDNASRVSSSTGDVIFTPPETPRASSSPQLQPGATLYMESRPPPHAAASMLDPLVHPIDVRDASSADDLPYPADWAAHDVTAQDWATFVNFLLPDHTARGNETVIDRKLKAEGSADDGASRSHAQAQLQHMRESGSEAVSDRADAEATVQQWNRGFFGPRGLHLRLVPSAEPQRMPGSWDAAPDAHVFASRPPPPLGPQNYQQQPQAGTRTWGGFSIGGDSIRFGNRFVADSNGLRIGNLVMDNNGIRIDGQGNAPPTRGLAPLPPFPPQPPPPPPPPPFMGSFGPFGHSGEVQVGRLDLFVVFLLLLLLQFFLVFGFVSRIPARL